MEAKTHRISITLQMDNALHKNTWKTLSKIPKGNRTEYICNKVCDKQDKKALADIVQKSVTDALKRLDLSDFYQGEPQLNTKDEAEEIEENFLGFNT